MKKLLILTTFLSSLMMTSVANAEWTKVAGNVNASFYLDFERVRKHDGKIFYWELIDLKKPSENGNLSFKVYSEAECGAFRSRYLSHTSYKGPMGAGESLLDNNQTKNWYYPSPNSTNELVLKIVCNHKRMQ